MDENDLLAKLDSEIKSELKMSLQFGFDWSKSIIKPVKQPYLNAIDHSNSNEYWTVIIDQEKNKILFYSAEDDIYGLASINSTNDLIDLGYYGTLSELILFIQ